MNVSENGEHSRQNEADDREKIMKILRDTISKDAKDWESLWKQNISPWDLGMATPALKQELIQYTDGDLGRALIPGCGGGYDLVTLVEHKKMNGGLSEIVGLDISETCIEKTKRVLKDSPNVSIDDVTLVTGDFFDFEYKEPFDFVFDYTFFCALPPRLRSSWGSRIGELVKKKSGRLLTLIYPINDERASDYAKLTGPPFSVSLEEYSKALSPHGFVLDRVHKSSASVSKRAEHEMVAWWTKND